MSEKNIRRVYPSKFRGPIPSSAYLHECCSGCPYVNDMSSELSGFERFDKCSECIPKLDEAYSGRKPFEFNTETLEITIIK